MKSKTLISLFIVIVLSSCGKKNQQTEGVWDIPFGSSKTDIKKLKPKCKILRENNDYIELQGQCYYGLFVAKACFKLIDDKMVSGAIYTTYVYAPPQFARIKFDSITQDLSRKYNLPIRNSRGDSIRAQESPGKCNAEIHYWAYDDNNQLMDAQFKTKNGLKYLVCIYPYNRIILIKGEVQRGAELSKH